MRYIHIICIGLIVLLLGASAKAEGRRGDGNELLLICESKRIGIDDVSNLAWCYGYMNGIRDMQTINEAIPNLSPLCVPPAVTQDQMARIVVKYLQNHPEKLHWGQSALTYNALAEAFPCPVQSAPQ